MSPKVLLLSQPFTHTNYFGLVDHTEAGAKLLFTQGDGLLTPAFEHCACSMTSHAYTGKRGLVAAHSSSHCDI